MLKRLTQYKTIAFIFLLIFSFCSVWALIVPDNNEAPDEASHLNMIDFFKAEHRIPVFNNEEKIIPTQYDPGLLSGAYYSMAYNSPLNYLPYLLFNHKSLGKSDILPMRLVSAFLIALFAVFLFLSLKNILPRNEKTALAITVFIGLIPQIVYSGSYINIEPLALCFSSLTFYFYTKLTNRLVSYLPFAISLGLMGLVKANYFIFIGYLLFLLFYDLFANQKGRKLNLKGYLIAAVIFIAFNLWWWIRNYQLYGDPLILSYIKREIIDRAPGWFHSMREQGYNIITIFTYPYFYRFTFLGFFANLGGANIFLPVYYYYLFYLTITGLFAVSLGSKAKKYIIAFSIITILALIYFANKNLDDFSPQGRHLFPLLIPLSVIVNLGLNSLRSKWKRFVEIFLPILSFAASVTGILLTIDRYFIKGTAYVNLSSREHFQAVAEGSDSRYLKVIDLMHLPSNGMVYLLVFAVIFLVAATGLIFQYKAKE
jgi:hypothetical protein